MKQHRRIGVIMAKAYRDLNHLQLCGILEQAYALGYSVYVFTLTAENGDPRTMAGEENLLNLINFSELDGILYLPYTFSADTYRTCIEQFLQQRCPLPVVAIGLGNLFCPTIWHDDRAEFREIVRHLIIEHGCQRIHCLTGPEGDNVAEQRLAGYRDAMEETGLHYTQKDITYGDFWVSRAQMLAKEFTDGTLTLPDAVVCANDIMAISLCDALAERGISVPEQVRITGYDGTLESILHVPPITTYSTSWRQLARNAMCFLYETITGIPAQRLPVEQGILSARESCGCQSTVNRPNAQQLDYQRLEDNMTDCNLSTQFLNAGNLSSFIQKTYNMTYLFLKPEQCGNEQFSICLCEDWDRTQMDGEIQTYRTTGYSEQMILINYDGRRTTFPSSQMVPDNALAVQQPSVTFFNALHFQDHCFGYTILMLRGMVDTFNPHYLHFCHEINIGLEFLSTQNALQSLAYRRYLSQIRDELTGLYNTANFAQQWAEQRNKAQQGTLFLIGFTLSGMHRIKETCGSLVWDRYLVEFSDLMRNCCRNQEQCFRADESAFFILGTQHSEEEQQSLIQRIAVQFEKQYQNTSHVLRPRLHHAIVPDCGALEDGTQASELLLEQLRSLSSSPLSFSEQMHYDDLAALRSEIYQFPERDWSIAACCRKLSISPSYFHRIYRSTFGVSCTQDILKSKLDHAKKLLLSTTDTLQIIAQKCGYDYSHFMRTFKKEVGMTPTEYRRGGKEV